MKVLIVVSLALFAIAQALPNNDVQQDKLKIPEKCSDVLAVKVCDRLDRMAKQLKLKSEEVKTAVLEAYKQGKTKSEELYKKSKEILQEKVLSKKCEDVTTVQTCDKLRKMAADLKVKAEFVAKFVMKEVANLKTKECEDFLSVDECKKIEDLTNKLKIRIEKVQDMMVDAYLDAKTKGTKMLTETYNKVKTYVMTTKCEDMFNPGLCTSFRKYAEKTKVALPVIMETAYDLVQKGVAIGTGLAKKVYDIVDHFYDCTDIFEQKSCDRMEKWAASLKVKADEFQRLVKKYVRVAMEKGTSIYKTIKDFVKNKITCRFTSGCSNPEDSDEMQDDFTYSIPDYLNKLKAHLKKVLSENFKNLTPDQRAKITNIINTGKSMFVDVGKEILKSKGIVREALRKLLVEITTFFPKSS